VPGRSTRSLGITSRSNMPDSVREYLFAIFEVIAMIAGVSGIVWLRAAGSLEQHLGALTVCAGAGVFAYGGYLLKRKEGRHNIETPELPSAGTEPNGGARDT